MAAVVQLWMILNDILGKILDLIYHPDPCLWEQDAKLTEVQQQLEDAPDGWPLIFDNIEWGSIGAFRMHGCTFLAEIFKEKFYSIHYTSFSM